MTSFLRTNILLSTRVEEPESSRSSIDIRRIFRQDPEQQDLTLATLINTNQDYENFINRGIHVLNPRVLYGTNILDFTPKRFTISKEVKISYLGEDLKELLFFNKDTEKELLKLKAKFIHIGLITIGIKVLHRRELGYKTLSMILDGRINSPLEIMLGAIEVDMSNNQGIFYCAPDIILDITEFFKFFKLGLMTKGYENWSHGTNNLVITLNIIARLTNNLDHIYKLKVDKIVSLLSSQGIKMIQPTKMDSKLLAGTEWKINKKFQPQTHLIPENGLYYTDSKSDISMRFKSYKKTKINEEEDVDA